MQQHQPDHDHWMGLALEQAKRAWQQGEIPVGAVLVRDNKLIASGFNLSITHHDATAHAEIIVMREAGQNVENYRLVDSTLYVTLEPCPMCASAAVHGRIKQIVFGAYDAKTGACGSVMNLAQHSALNHQIDVIGGVREEECSSLISDFFKWRRQQKKAAKNNKS
jgi:tRNA(adenine34) deaminase